jgi:hypothetical protein
MPTHERLPAEARSAKVGRRSIRRVAIVLGVAAVMTTVACWPATRFVGVDFVVTQQSLPLWVKAMEFIDRDRNLASTAQAVLGGIDGDDAKAAAALGWTRANIRNAPAGMPIIDDHIWHIVIRGYGQSDQQADVFTTLLTYEGVRAYWTFIGTKPDEIPISYVLIRDRWRVFDVARGLVFRNAVDDLATPEQIAADHNLIRAVAAPVVDDVEGYVARFAGYAAPPAPDVLRADLQMPGRRLWYEIRRPLGMQGREWQMRPPAVSTRAEVRP